MCQTKISLFQSQHVSHYLATTNPSLHRTGQGFFVSFWGTNLSLLRFEFFTAMKMYIIAFWVITLCSSIDRKMKVKSQLFMLQRLTRMDIQLQSFLTSAPDIGAWLSFTPLLLYSSENPWYTLNMRPGMPQNWSGFFGEETNLLPL